MFKYFFFPEAIFLWALRSAELGSPEFQHPLHLLPLTGHSLSGLTTQNPNF